MPIMERIEGWFSITIQRYHFTVDDRVVRQFRECVNDTRIAGVEVVIVPGTELNFAVCFKGKCAIAVQLDFLCGALRYVAPQKQRALREHHDSRKPQHNLAAENLRRNVQNHNGVSKCEFARFPTFCDQTIQ
ncbi:MAG TPA: hypothetical protein VG322_06365 [Candidatus Acidoferrales bacterium]|jgi:phosphoribosylformylglycinamidine (FGAM) synthase-like enzyme|nr:hypothetical protein [Candidatus Acidoferrales bacterium]